MQTNQHHPYCLELLNEIHANRAARKLVGGRNFPTTELIEICKSVGDLPTWDQAAQPALVAATLDVMARRDPWSEE